MYQLLLLVFQFKSRRLWWVISTRQTGHTLSLSFWGISSTPPPGHSTWSSKSSIAYLHIIWEAFNIRFAYLASCYRSLARVFCSKDFILIRRSGSGTYVWFWEPEAGAPIIHLRSRLITWSDRFGSSFFTSSSSNAVAKLALLVTS